MKVLVTGAGGQLGGAIARRFARDHEVVAHDRRSLDITSAAALRDTLHRSRPDAIVNCAAYNAVDLAEDQPLQALAINSLAVRLLSQAARECGAALVHYGTDFVFDGATTTPYVEDDAPSPRGTYAMSKLLGEWFAMDAPRHYVLRVESLFGGARPKSSVDLLLSQLLDRQPVRVFADRMVSPSHVDDVAEATCALLERNAPSGLYHCVNTGWTDWLTLARELARLADRPDANFIAMRLEDAALRVPRPLFAALSNDKLRGAGVDMPTWQSAVARHVAAVLAARQAAAPAPSTGETRS